MSSAKLLVIQIQEQHLRKTLQDVSTGMKDRKLWLYSSKGLAAPWGQNLFLSSDICVQASSNPHWVMQLRAVLAKQQNLGFLELVQTSRYP